ncbi:protein pangolin, isoforms A/H/I/S-like isoform X2 [Argiope bruennichi]|uniref:protein pangolin, isoforms A/H/I/S-like isoform X2 n=1 Tax=Argiope bruennichi TaxID=94029 RepID=UPI002494E9C0|nr:protein pangolin, isoforms A/H/I/S-like isoform X2 [Argiope bruennichi]
MPHASDISPDDELKVYQNEGEAEDEERSSAENLKEVKTSLVTEVVDEEEQHRKNASSFIPSSKPSRSLAEPIGPHLPGKHFEYLSPTFGYVMSPYHPHPNGPYGAISMVNRVPLVPPNHSPSPLPFMMYSSEQCQPPPAHMGISHLNHKTGIGRAPVYPLASPSQFHPPIFSPDFQQFPWSHPSSMYSMASSFRYPPAMPIPPANMQNKYPSYPGMFSPGIHNSMGNHPIMTPGPKIESSDHQDNRGFSSFSPISSPLSQTQNTSNHAENTPRSRSEQKKSHIKKPLNAFMLFMKEQRPLVVKEVTLKESAAINQILGKRWHALSREEQAKYYEKASIERQQHRQRYPDWTARDNYAINTKKKKRKRDKSQDGDGNNPKKCRARFGLDKQESWCKPCRRKKKCIAYRSGSDNTAGESEDNIGSVESMGSLEAPTPDSRYSADTNDGSDSGNHEPESSEFSLSSPPIDSLPSVSSPTSVPRPVERVQSLNGDSHTFNIQHLTNDRHPVEEGDVHHVGLPTPPSTDSSTTAMAPS